jgi:hypothetical protein
MAPSASTAAACRPRRGAHSAVKGVRTGAERDAKATPATNTPPASSSAAPAPLSASSAALKASRAEAGSGEAPGGGAPPGRGIAAGWAH